MLKLFTDLFTEPDNVTFCPTRIAIGAANLAYHGAAAAGFFVGQLHLDIATLGQYVQHMTMLIGFGTTAIAVKSKAGGDANAAG